MQLTIEEIIKITDAKVVSAGAGASVSGVAALKDASAQDVSFLGNEKYYQDYLSTTAGVVLVPSVVEQYPSGVTILEVENPSFSFGKLVSHFASNIRKFKAGAHPRAIIGDDVTFDPEKVSIKAGVVIEDGVSIGDGTEINPGVCLGVGVKIGRDCVIHANVTVREYCEIGDNVILQPGCVIGSDGYGYELVDGCHVKIDQVGVVKICDDVEIGANTTIDRARFGKTVIGQGSKIDNLVQIGHNAVVGDHCLIVSQSALAGSCELGKYVTVAGQVGVAGHIKIGDKTVLLSRTGAAKSLAGGQMYMGMPARPVKDEQKKLAALARLPKALTELKELRRKVAELSAD